MRFLEAILSPAMDIHNVVQHAEAFDVRVAAGDQLDMIGAIVGVDRELPYIPASGEPNMTDDEYSIAIQLRIAQEAWNGSNNTAVEIYDRIVGESINIDYEDNGDCSVTINVDLAAQNIAQVFSATSEFLVAAGVDKTVSVNDEPTSEIVYYGISVTGIEYEDSIEIYRGDS